MRSKSWQEFWNKKTANHKSKNRQKPDGLLTELHSPPWNWKATIRVGQRKKGKKEKKERNSGMPAASGSSNLPLSASGSKPYNLRTGVEEEWSTTESKTYLDMQVVLVQMPKNSLSRE